MNTVRVLHVVSTLGMGGAETWLLELMKHIRRQGEGAGLELQCDIFLTGENKGALEPEFENLGVTLIRGRFSKNNLVGFTKSFRRALREKDYDAIHDHQDNIAGLHFLAGIGHLPSVRIAHVHNPLLHLDSYSSSATRKATVKAGRYCLRRLGTHVLGTSGQVLREYGFNAKRFSHLAIMPLYCGIDPTSFALSHDASKSDVISEFDLPRDANIALFVGRLDSGHDQKNPWFALDTAREAIKDAPNLFFLMAGAWGDVGGKLTEIVAQWEAAPNIRILGVRRDVPRLMAAADVLLVPSLQEGLGMVIVEAQAAELPVVASDSIPKESAVVSSMVEFLPLYAGPCVWARALLRKIERGRPNGQQGNRSVSDSPFAINNSAKHLIDVYLSGTHR